MVDTQLADRAHRALLNNPHLPHSRVRLLARQGRITLEGVVRSYYQKQMAQESLRQVEGVSEIENLLKVEWL